MVITGYTFTIIQEINGGSTTIHVYPRYYQSYQKLLVFLTLMLSTYKVNESEIFQNTTGSTANPYFLVYVKADDADSLVETIVKPPINPAA